MRGESLVSISVESSQSINQADEDIVERKDIKTHPVRVATSTTHSGSHPVVAYQSASANTSLPSASVLSISILVPFMAWMTSPGLDAEGPGMFSERGVRTVRFIL